MKKMHVMALAIVFVIAGTSCSKTAPPELQLGGSGPLIPGTWKVSYYAENMEPNGALLNGYSFVFSDDSLSVINDHLTYPGTWVTGVSDNHNFGKSMDIFIEGSEELSILNREWDISMLTGESMRLRYDYDGLYLEFELDKVISE